MVSSGQENVNHEYGQTDGVLHSHHILRVF